MYSVSCRKVCMKELTSKKKKSEQSSNKNIALKTTTTTKPLTISLKINIYTYLSTIQLLETEFYLYSVKWVSYLLRFHIIHVSEYATYRTLDNYFLHFHTLNLVRKWTKESQKKIELLPVITGYPEILSRIIVCRKYWKHLAQETHSSSLNYLITLIKGFLLLNKSKPNFIVCIN